MVMVYQSLHSLTSIKIGKIIQMEDSGTYTRKLKFSGYKGSMSKDEGVFEFLELTLFAETEKELELILK